jgi:hypothetical protein
MKRFFLPFLAVIAASSANASDVLDAQECNFWAGLVKQVLTDRDAGVTMEEEHVRIEAVSQDQSIKYLRDEQDRQFVLSLSQHAWMDPDATPAAAFTKVHDRCMHVLEMQEAKSHNVYRGETHPGDLEI